MTAAPLYFLHIAKTAGTSLTHYLDAQFSPQGIAPFRLTHELAAAVKQNPGCVSSYGLLRGHMGYAPALLSEKPLHIITLLREPVARTLSHYQHIIRHADHWLFADLPKKNLSLEAFLDFPPARQLITDFQVRNIAQDFDLTKTIADAARNVLNPNLGRLLAFVPPREAPDALLATATKRLKAMALCGTTERLDDFLTALAGRFGWPSPARPPKHNAAPEDLTQSITPALRKKIESLTELDAALYRTAQSLH